MSCANARVTEVGLSGRELRGSIPEAMGNLGALRSLKLHDNFLTGTMPTGLGKLHLLRELQLSHNQLAMQDRNSLSEIFGGLMYLRTLDMGMSDEKEDLTKTIVQPTPPLTCHVGEPCTLQLSTRTSDGLQLPHGGKQMRVTNAADPTAQECTCTDRMDGTYSCIFPPAWTSHKDEFDFVVLSADQEEFVPLRTLVDPTTGVESTVETYGRLGVIVPPIDCPQIHSYANVDGSQCVCEAGYYNMAYQGGWSCETCVRGREPIEQGTRCQPCAFGKFSAAGQSYNECPAGEEPNLDSGAESCIICNEFSTSVPGQKCERCPIEQLSDASRTSCVCPRDMYNSTALDQSIIQCLTDNHRRGAINIKAGSKCVSCSDVPCVDCDSGEFSVRTGWSTSGTEGSLSQTPWFVFACPDKEACLNSEERKCRDGHTGELCNVCSQGYGMVKSVCTPCMQCCELITSHDPVLAGSGIAGCGGGVCRSAPRS